jgi:hypothetical protein
VNVASNDFRLQASSPAINAGAKVDLFEDFKGNPVPQDSAIDIGAIEFHAILPPAGLQIRRSNTSILHQIDLEK